MVFLGCREAWGEAIHGKPSEETFGAGRKLSRFGTPPATPC